MYVFYVSWRLLEAHLYVFYVSGRLRGGPGSNHLKGPGGSAKEGSHACGGRGRVWEALGGSIYRILYAARRPADPVKSCPCFILRRFLPRASYLEISFCAPFGALRLSARLIPNRISHPESKGLSLMTARLRRARETRVNISSRVHIFPCICPAPR